MPTPPGPCPRGRRGARRIAPVACALALALGPGAPDAHAGEAAGAPPSATDVLERAFSNLYDCDTTATIELVMRARSGGERRRVFETASKRIDDRLHSIGRLVAPAHLRGLTVLSIEAENRSHDTLIYMPSLQRVRRVTSAQRGDSFLGSDLTYEDFERRRTRDLAIEAMHQGTLGGEPVWVVRARSKRGGSYARVEFRVARADWALLETRYFKRGAETPYRVVEALRGDMLAMAGHVLPTRITVRDSLRGTTTEVRLSDLVINPELDDRLFTVATLEQKRALDHFER